MKITSQEAILPSPLPINPLGATAFREGDVIPFSWLNTGGATSFQVEIYKNNQLVISIPWQYEAVKLVDSLLQGEYTWRVRGRNTGSIGTWSVFSTFSVVSPISPPDIKTVPYSDTMETTQALWARDGLWTYSGNGAMARSGTHSWWYQNAYGNYDNNQPNSGSLTSPPFSITEDGFYLRFYYRYQTETQGKTWDQRWIQISVDGEPFQTMAQSSDDPQIPETSSWLLNKAIDLSEYAGHIIRIRFQFVTWDAAGNNYAGWGIDDFSITSTTPQNCDDDRQDDTPGQAFLLTYDTTITVPGQICPNGDLDYYKFYGTAGDRIVADVDAMSIDSLLDPYLVLLDSDGQTVIAENDDEVYAQFRDPLLGYTLDKDGIYYLKLRAWKNPLVGGNDYSYKIRLYEDHNPPGASITWPSSYTYLPDTVMDISVDVTDEINGINRVEFYWHSSDWLPGEWVFMGEDRDETGGWSMPFDPVDEPEGNQGAFFVKAYDMAGNYTSMGAWNLGIDKAAPVTEMKPLEATQPSNAFLLEWNAADNLSGIDFVEIQEKMNNGNWTTFPPIDGTNYDYWIIGTPGNAYAYRMHGIDFSGNSESYPTAAEAITAVPEAEVLCYAPDNYDSSGNDNSPTNASNIDADGVSQIHNYCNPLSPNYQNDEDWTKLSVVQGEHYLIHSHANSIQTATIISLFADDGTTLITESVPEEFGDSTFLIFTPEQDQTVYIRFRHLDGRVIGADVVSIISVNTGSLGFIPLINK